MLTPYTSTVDMRQVIAALPGHYTRDRRWQAKGNASAADRYTLQSPNGLNVNIDDSGYYISSQVALDLSLAASWDTTSPTDYTVAADRAGKDFCIYACQPDPALQPTPVLLVSAASTFPSGYTADNSRKIGGFHCLCVSVGTIASHTLSDYTTGDVLPASVWDLKHRPISSPDGMVYDTSIGKWVDIYLASGTGSSTASVYGVAAKLIRNWMDFVDDGAAVKKRLAHDFEFQSLAAGSNEQTSHELGSTTGGNSDTAGRRMISNIGCEDCCGMWYQFLLDQSWQATGLPDTGDPAWASVDLPGDKGSLWKQGTYGDVKLIAGGTWGMTTACGSRCRSACNYRWLAPEGDVGARFLAEPISDADYTI